MYEKKTILIKRKIIEKKESFFCGFLSTVTEKIVLERLGNVTVKRG